MFRVSSNHMTAERGQDLNILVQKTNASLFTASNVGVNLAARQTNQLQSLPQSGTESVQPNIKNFCTPTNSMNFGSQKSVNNVVMSANNSHSNAMGTQGQSSSFWNKFNPLTSSSYRNSGKTSMAFDTKFDAHKMRSSHQNLQMSAHQPFVHNRMSGFPSSRAFTRSNIVMRALPNSASTNDFYITHNDRKPAFLADLRERDACGVGFIANLKGIKSNKVLQEGLQALSCNEHRGGCNFDKITGDGAGIMTQIPWKILHQWAMDKKLNTIDENNTIVGTFFLEQDGHDKARMEINKLIDQSNFELIGWREVPVDDSVLGPMAKDAQPKIFQLVIKGKNIPEDRIEAMGYILRKKIQIHLNATFGEQATSVVSFSSKTIVYKGMLKSDALKSFYKDLSNPDYETQFSIYHRRFSTNTMPRWSLAQPMKILGHNGEINTYLGNLNWEESRENSYESVKLGKEIKDILPIIDTTGSDSYALDQLIELLIMNGDSPFKAMMMVMPEAYKNQPDIVSKPEIVNFYEFYGGHMESWDGPANVTFSDGNYVGANLDRNGLRPARFEITDDGFIYFGSEVGNNQLDQSKVIEKGRLGPGQMFAVDLKTGELLYNWDIKQKVASEYPYGQWLKEHRVLIKENKGFLDEAKLEEGEALQQQTAFGYTEEDIKIIVETLAEDGAEATFSMGEDTPLAFISSKPRVLYDYFKQRFAQVTNPPIDPLREGLVMSLDVHLGKKGNILAPKPEQARQIKLSSPVLIESNLEEIKSQTDFNVKTVSLVYGVGGDMKENLNRIVGEAVQAVKDGSEIVIISDRGVNDKNTYIPSVIATGAIHHRLIHEGLRSSCSIVVDTAQCWNTHHFAVLIGYGASAVCPYLTLETIRQNQNSKKDLTIQQRQLNYKKGIEKGVLKIMSKMGISLLSCYQGGQIFEIIGLSDEVVDVAFRGSVSRVGGMNFNDIAKEVKVFQDLGYSETLKKLVNQGFFRAKAGGEYHFNNMDAVKFLHKAIRDKDYDHYKLYEDHLSKRPPVSLRDLVEFNSQRQPIPVDEVESAADICKRFVTGGMSLGALSPEAHETLAIAMNRIGGLSNSGEGGEDKKRYETINDVDAEGKSKEQFSHLSGLQNGDSACSGTKQIASGRFGVTPEYLQSAKQLEIKVAQGAKPGEGGQLPGNKVSEYIAGLRYSKPGVTLISPPPHHDIYSIEDLAQLIYDLHEVNQRAKISVKLVAEIGIGTIASGVAKAQADIIQISGHEGGTAASPISSMKHAGGLWELGLVETHQTLQENKLRDRVILRVDGGLRGGWEIVMAAILGADEFGFGSIAMIAEGCVMARVCHLNSCPVGIATQKEELRARFKGTPQNVVDFFFYLSQEVREVMARLGYRTIDELIGQTHLLKQKDNMVQNKASQLDLSYVLDKDQVFQNTDFIATRSDKPHSNGNVLDDDLINDQDFQSALLRPVPVTKTYEINNVNRSVCARVSGVLAQKFGDKGFDQRGGALNITFNGSAGQSFAAFLVPGMNITLIGQSNDYVGKSMCGGNLVIKKNEKFLAESDKNTIIGNTCFYGATGGNVYISGRAGERLAVRNSGAKIIVEGAGDHCCEYMTGGRVVVLGKIGRNLGAGMTGGLAYVYDDNTVNFEKKINTNVRIQRLITDPAEQELKELLQSHFDQTGSKIAKKILDNFDEEKQKFWQIVPPSEDSTQFTCGQEECLVFDGEIDGAKVVQQ